MSVVDLQKAVSESEGDEAAVVDQSLSAESKGHEDTVSPTKSSWRGTAKKQTSWKKSR
jgi:hypothetical protein